MLIVIIIIIIILGIWAFFTYNNLIKLKDKIKEAWNGIDAQLKRRYNLISNLMTAMKDYQSRETGVFQKLTELRTKAMAAENLSEKAQLESALSRALRRLFAVTNNHLDLKASVNIVDLQQDLEQIEGKLQVACRSYDGMVRDYNTRIQTFPMTLIAKTCHLKAKDYFKLD